MIIHDITMTIHEDMMVYPDDPKVVLKPYYDMSKGDAVNVTAMAFGSHTGTHVDIPKHFINDSPGLQEYPLDAFIGSAIVVEVSEPCISEDCITQLDIPPSYIALFRTKNSQRVYEKVFFTDYVYPTLAAAEALVKKQVKAVGIDFLTIGKHGEENTEVHNILLSNGIPIIEGLDLSGVKAGKYKFIGLPLKLMNGNGSPIRAVLVE